MPKQTFSEKLQALIEKEPDVHKVKSGLENGKILLDARIEKINKELQEKIDGYNKLKTTERLIQDEGLTLNLDKYKQYSDKLKEGK